MKKEEDNGANLEKEEEREEENEEEEEEGEERGEYGTKKE